MYESRQSYMKEKAERVKKDPAGGNRTGIPTAIKNQYEAASGLSFDDVRIHYNSHKPERLQALAYTQGNHVYMGPGQEKHLRHELGHVVQQKLGLVRSTMWVNGLPVNTDSGLERQAESGIIPMHNDGNGGYGKAHLASGDPGLVRKYVSESAENPIQGLFLRWVSEKEETFLTEVERGERCDYDTAGMRLGQVFGLMGGISDAGLIRKLSMEMNDRLYQTVDPNEVENILESLHNEEDTVRRIVNALDDDCFNWLLNAVNNTKVSAGSRQAIRGAVQERLRQPAAPGNRPYLALRDKIRGLERKIHFVQGLQEQTDYEKNRKVQLLQLLRWELRGYFRLLGKFPGDLLLQNFRDKLNRLEQSAAELVPEEFSSSHVFPGEVYVRDRHAVTYAAQESQKVFLPERNQLPAVINDDEPVRRFPRQSITDLAREILERMEQTGTRERLVIYRSMDAVEALSILRFFNTSKALAVEEAIKDDGPERSFDVHDRNNFVELGKHYGEYAQAAKYFTVQERTPGKIMNYANVLLAFVLKPGAKELIFSKSLLALPDSELRRGHEGFALTTGHEGTTPGYIGVKAERIGESGTFSLGVAESMESRILLQLLIDRVEVEKILYKENPREKKQTDLSVCEGEF